MITYKLNIFQQQDEWQVDHSDLPENTTYNNLEDFFERLTLLDNSNHSLSELMHSIILEKCSSSYLNVCLNNIKKFLNYKLNKVEEEQKKLIIQDLSLIEDILNNYINLRFMEFIYNQIYLENMEINIILMELQDSIISQDLINNNIEYDSGNFLFNIEKELITKALLSCSNKTKVAQMLGISIKTLYNKIEDFDLKHLTSTNNEDDKIDILPLSVVEKNHIIKMLKQYNGNKLMVAQALDISDKGLYNKLHEYDLMPFSVDKTLNFYKNKNINHKVNDSN